jgi:hypothetical protein
MANEVAATTQQRREVTQVIDAVPMFDTARFEHMQRVASIMARSSMIPKTLCMVKEGNNDVMLPFENILSNCFLVVNQATRWGMDPFAVISCCSVVHGRLAYEGKLVAAVLEAKLGVSLIYEWDNNTGDAFGIVVTGTLPDGRVESVDGTVGQWKTTGSGSPWVKQPKLQLAYRGAREWARLYAPGVMLGVYGEEELADLVEDARARRANPVNQDRPVLSRLAGEGGGGGGNRYHVDRDAGGDAGASSTAEAGADSQETTGGTNEVAETEEDQTRLADASETENGSAEATQETGKAGESSATNSKDKASDTPAPSDAGTSAAGGGSSSQPDLLSGTTGGSAQSTEGQAPATGGADGARGNDTPSAPDRLRSYSKALASIENGGPPKLVRQGDAWIKKWGAFEGAAEHRRAEIYNAHLNRLTGSTDMAACQRQVEEIIAK